MLNPAIPRDRYPSKGEAASGSNRDCIEQLGLFLQFKNNNYKR